MSNFKQQYHGAFDDIHAPNSIKKEVIQMSKTLNDNFLNTTNRIVETSEAEVSSKFNASRLFAVVTCVTLVVVSGFGFNYLKNSSQMMTVGSSSSNDETTSISNTVPNAITMDNSNFGDIFGVSFEDLQSETLFVLGCNDKSLVKYCDSSDEITAVLNSLNTSQWKAMSESLDEYPQYAEQYSELILTLYTPEYELHAYFSTFPSEFEICDENTVYVGVNIFTTENYAQQTEPRLKYYSMDSAVFENIYKTLESNNYFRFDVNPSNKIDVTICTNNDTFNETYTITDKDTISEMGDLLFNGFNWNLGSNIIWDSDEFDESVQNATKITISYDVSQNQEGYMEMYLLDDAIWLKTEITILDFGGGIVYKPMYFLTSSNLEENCQKFIEFIQS